MQPAADIAPRLLPDWLLSKGRPWVTNAEIMDLLGVSPHEANRVAGRWQAKALAFSPARGLQVLIPSEYRSWQALPAEQFVDPMMRHLGHPYYVGYLSAAEIHGAAHQRPQVFQVVTNARVRDKQFGRVRVSFHTASAMADLPTVTVNTETGTITVAAIETLVLDLAARPRLSGGTSNVATIIGELLSEEKVDIAKAAALADRYPVAAARRLGWLLEFMAGEVGATIDAEPLRRRVVSDADATPLIGSDLTRGPVDERWNVYINGEIEHDL
jgi:predicted transcriptional regulator of viral defense system